MRLATVPPTVAPMETSAPFGTPQLFLTDSRMVFTVLNHLRYQALNRVFGTSREQANALTAVLLLGAADSGYQAARRLSGMRLHGSDAGLGAIALREAALGVAGPGARAVPGFGALVAFALLGGLAAPGLRRMGQRMRAAEKRVRRERIRRYVAARDRGLANAA
jgi:hypothetical protein